MELNFEEEVLVAKALIAYKALLEKRHPESEDLDAVRELLERMGQA